MLVHLLVCMKENKIGCLQIRIQRNQENTLIEYESLILISVVNASNLSQVFARMGWERVRWMNDNLSNSEMKSV